MGGRREVWATLPSWPDYEVSNRGHVRKGSKEISVHRATSGYLKFMAQVPGQRTGKNIYAHRAVMEAFVGPCPHDKEVNHKNGNKQDNRLINLEYVTRSANGKHAFAMGLSRLPDRRATGDDHWTRRYPDRVKRGDENGARLHPERIVRGEDQHHAKLTERDVLQIRWRFAQSESQSSIARAFGVTSQNVGFIVRRESWKHVT